MEEVELSHGQDDDNEKRIRKRKKRLLKTICTQMEFYFSDSNLARDVFLSDLIKQSENGNVDVSIFLRFNKIQALTSEVKEVVQAVSSSEILETSVDEKFVRRVTPVQKLTDVDERTIYVENLPHHGDHNWLKDILKTFGKINYVSIPKFRKTGQCKGYAFVEFEGKESVESACKYYSTPSSAELPTLEDKTKLPNSKDENEDDSSAKKATKRKINEAEEIPNKRSKLTEKQTESQTEEETDESKIEAKKHKKHRKRKKKNKEKNEVDTLHLRVMTKKEWKRLRNKYLALQKANMAEVKRALGLITKKENFSSQNNQQISEPIKPSQCTSAAPEFLPGIIIKLDAREDVIDMSEIKKKLKSIPGVMYVDVKEGRPCIYIRCDSNSSTTDVANSIKSEGTVTILEGDAEKDYWKTIIRDREAKLNSKVRLKKRGMNKIMEKTISTMEKINSHIRFD